MGKLRVTIEHGGGGADAILAFLGGLGILMLATALVGPAIAAIGIVSVAVVHVLEVLFYLGIALAVGASILMGARIYPEIKNTKKEKDALDKWMKYSAEQNKGYQTFKAIEAHNKPLPKSLVPSVKATAERLDRSEDQSPRSLH